MMKVLKATGEAGLVGAGMSAPQWVSYIEYANTILAFGIALASFIYAVLRVYYLIQNKGESSSVSIRKDKEQ